MCSLNSSRVQGLFLRTLAVNCLQRNWQGTERLGELADQEMSSKRKMPRAENIADFQVSAILFIDIPGEVKLGLDTHNQSVKNGSICITDVHL
jgi:hypothetical protein